jgi:hypothetical protein
VASPGLESSAGYGAHVSNLAQTLPCCVYDVHRGHCHATAVALSGAVSWIWRSRVTRPGVLGIVDPAFATIGAAVCELPWATARIKLLGLPPVAVTLSANARSSGSGGRTKKATSSGSRSSTTLRGVKDILIACVDGLTGFSDAIAAVPPVCEPAPPPLLLGSDCRSRCLLALAEPARSGKRRSACS